VALLGDEERSRFPNDSFGRRNLNATGRNLLYEGWDVGQELSGSTPVANRMLGGTDEFVSRADSTGTVSPLTDASGSVLGLTDSSGNIVTQTAMTPLGARAVAEHQVPVRFRILDARTTGMVCTTIGQDTTTRKMVEPHLSSIINKRGSFFISRSTWWDIGDNILPPIAE